MVLGKDCDVYPAKWPYLSGFSKETLLHTYLPVNFSLKIMENSTNVAKFIEICEGFLKAVDKGKYRYVVV